MRIIEGEHVDLISPYPTKELERAAQWFFQYSTYINDDTSPKTPENIQASLAYLVDNATTYGIIDKNNITKSTHEVPLVGFVSFALQTTWNGYLHLATSRRAWGRKSSISLAEEAGKLAVEDLWNEHPNLMRQSVLVSSKNHPARRWAERIGFTLDGMLLHFFLSADKPGDAIHFGKLKTTKESSGDEFLE